MTLGIACLALLSACGDPLGDMARLSDTAASRETVALAKSPTVGRADEGGLFDRLTTLDADDPTNAVVQAALSEVTPRAAVANPQANGAQTRSGGGFFGLFGRGPGAGRTSGTGPDTADVEPGTLLPFGQIARVCGLSRAAMGTPIEAASGFNLYDTSPSSMGLRPYYLTGFDDNCARTFTGAVVVTGDVETHEFVRYEQSNARIAYTSTDNAYEALKAGTCRVPSGTPCGARTANLDRDTQFITVYNFFGGTFSAVPTEWAQILVHDGEVLSISITKG